MLLELIKSLDSLICDQDKMIAGFTKIFEKGEVCDLALKKHYSQLVKNVFEDIATYRLNLARGQKKNK